MDDRTKAMQVFIDWHLQEAFKEIKQEFDVIPVSVSIQLTTEQAGNGENPENHYAGCSVSLNAVPGIHESLHAPNIPD